jgi:lon-related putative ATP-dependent protease
MRETLSVFRLINAGKGDLSMKHELTTEQLRYTCDPESLGCVSSKEISALERIIGQERAARSLEFGLGIDTAGFNIYVAGLPGTGRTTTVHRFLEDRAKAADVPSDWCYVNNFKDPSRPQALTLPPGRAKELQSDLSHLIDAIKQDIRAAFESEEYITQKQQTVKQFENQRDELIQEMNNKATKAGFLIQASPVGLVTVPLRDGKPIPEGEFEQLSQEEKDRISKEGEKLQAEINSTIRQAKRFERQAGEAVEKLDREVVAYTIKHPIEELKEKYSQLPDLIEYLEVLREDILENSSQFRADSTEEETPAILRFAQPKADLKRRYQVNVLIDNGELEGAPVIIERNPTYSNLFGRIEQEAQFGALITDFTLIRSGSLHRANGGYLVMGIDDLLRNPFSWEGLKRALANGEISIEDISERIGLITTKSLQPKAIPLSVKVLLIGTAEIYHLLRAFDEDFSELFKVKAEFDSQMDRSDENVSDYASFVCTICEEEGLLHLDASALAKVVEYGSRLAEDQSKLSTRFRDIADILREANYYARQEQSELVGASHITKAIDERIYRSNLIQERIAEMIERDIIKIESRGELVGQVNGLSVVELGDLAFGRPSRITASVSLGREGLIDIEREANLGGPIHTKGVMIISGYLAEKFAQDKPLSLSARLVFEQSYSGVEGDSASSTELYAILSSLSGVPIKQSIAVTGSVNQKGEIQAIGGVNEKIEGYFEVCKAKGLNGKQGVMIPQSNVENLMLKEDVVEAVQEGKFHIWPVSTIDEGIEILTGIKAGERLEDGAFEEGSLNSRVNQQLLVYAESLRDFSRSEHTHSAF